MNDVRRSGSTWEPLRHPVFRALWIATVISFVGTFMQDLAAPYLMTTMTRSPVLIAMMPTATSIAMVLLALPAGAIADIVDRRRLLLAAQAGMTLVALLMAGLTHMGWMRPVVLLVLTFAMAAGGALNSPAWAAIIPELVGMEQLPSAIALNSVAFNLARAIGPALGGLVLVAFRPEGTFFLNALSFLGVIYVLYRWKRDPIRSALPSERLVGAMRAGLRYVRFAPTLRIVMLRTAGFIVFASVMWALLPLVAREQLHKNEVGYGILMACMGGGALVGATLMPRLRHQMSMNALIGWSTLLYTCGLLGIGNVRVFWIACVSMGLMGASWLLVLSSLNVAAQASVPAWVRARVLAVYLAVFFLGFAIGAATWGFAAKHFGIPTAFTSAAAGLTLSVLALWQFRVSDAAINTEPSRHWKPPMVAQEPRHEHGPVLITVTYRVDPAQVAAFAQAMEPLRLMRLRDGAIRWGLWSDASDAGRVVESFVVESWLAHLRQHERVTMADRTAQEAALRMHIGDTPPVVAHFVAQSLGDR